MSLHFAFVMDPMESINIHTDTSFALMLKAFQKGHAVYHVHPKDLSMQQERVQLLCTPVEVYQQLGAHYKKRPQEKKDALDFQALFIRTDPPFDVAYLTATWILSFAEEQGLLCINSPRGIRNANEKLYALRFAQDCPQTLISSHLPSLRNFVQQQQKAILKPLDGHGGSGVFLVDSKDANLSALLELLTADGRRSIVCQAYVTAATKPIEKRLFMINGKLRGAIQRLPQAGDHRGNLHAGGRVALCDISDSDQAIAQRLGPQLKEDGLFFVGLDVIADKLIEVNVTSPTLIQQLLQLQGIDLAEEIISHIEQTRSR